MLQLEIGRRFEGDFLPEKEGPVLDFNRDRLNLVVKLNGISNEEARAFETTDSFSFALYLAQDALFMLIEIPGLLDWSDAPYSVATLPADQWPATSAVPESGRLKLNVVLVEGQDRTIRGMREFQLDTDFSTRLIQHVEELKKSPPSAAAFMEKVAVIQTQQTPKKMVKAAAAIFPQKS